MGNLIIIQAFYIHCGMTLKWRYKVLMTLEFSIIESIDRVDIISVYG